jgi:broad specificity phosphatase PhoE
VHRVGVTLVHVYITHPQVVIDPAVPVPRWALSNVGRARAEAMTAEQWVRRIQRIVSSDETKAIETAEILARALGLHVEVREGMHENDRSATGFLPPPEFEVTADRFFAEPDRSVRGWERAVDAQRRIVEAIGAALAEQPDLATAFVGHGGVGTLLYCWLADAPIDRRYDQGPGGGGNYFAFDLADRRALQGWRRIDASNSRR